MSRLRRHLGPIALIAVVAGCATLQQIAALQHVTFSFAGVSDVRIAGVRLSPNATYGSLGAANLARLGAALLAQDVPLEMIAHVDAKNPQENSVAAHMVALDWTMFLEDRRLLSGGLAEPVIIEPAHTSDVPLSVRLDLMQILTGTAAQDAFDTAMSIAGYGTVQKDLRLELSPTIDTSIGPIRYPSPIVVHRPAR